jgi:hypothetical protein
MLKEHKGATLLENKNHFKQMHHKKKREAKEDIIK